MISYCLIVCSITRVTAEVSFPWLRNMLRNQDLAACFRFHFTGFHKFMLIKNTAFGLARLISLLCVLWISFMVMIFLSLFCTSCFEDTFLSSPSPCFCSFFYQSSLLLCHLFLDVLSMNASSLVSCSFHWVFKYQTKWYSLCFLYYLILDSTLAKCDHQNTNFIVGETEFQND